MHRQLAHGDGPDALSHGKRGGGNNYKRYPKVARLLLSGPSLVDGLKFGLKDAQAMACAAAAAREATRPTENAVLNLEG